MYVFITILFSFPLSFVTPQSLQSVSLPSSTVTKFSTLMHRCPTCQLPSGYSQRFTSTCLWPSSSTLFCQCSSLSFQTPMRPWMWDVNLCILLFYSIFYWLIVFLHAINLCGVNLLFFFNIFLGKYNVYINSAKKIIDKKITVHVQDQWRTRTRGLLRDFATDELGRGQTQLDIQVSQSQEDAADYKKIFRGTLHTVCCWILLLTYRL